MSDLTASSCGCNSTPSRDNSCGCSGIIWIIILLCLCGNGEGGCGGSCGGGCGGGCGILGGMGKGGDCCELIIILLLLSCCGGGGGCGIF